MIAIIDIDGTMTYVDGPMSLEAAQEAVGGYVEKLAVKRYAAPDEWPALSDDEWGDMMMNEDGKRLELPMNGPASLIAQRVVLGNVVLMTGKDRWR
jgi:hypothetical protein